jgi:hypothetical protein
MKEEIEYYDDPGISTKTTKVPRWLIWVYILLPIWGLYWLISFWNGSQGWLDRGHWQQLQRAANTTFPQVNMITVEQDQNK